MNSTSKEISSHLGNAEAIGRLNQVPIKNIKILSHYLSKLKKGHFLVKKNNYYHDDFEKREEVWLGCVRETREPRVTIE